jgi:hypothetical protein
MTRRDFFKQATLALAALSIAKPIGLAASASGSAFKIDWRIEELTDAKPIYSVGDGLGWGMPEALPTGSTILKPGYQLTKTIVAAREKAAGIRLRNFSETAAPATIGKDEGLPDEIIRHLEALDPVWVAQADKVVTESDQVCVTRSWRTFPTISANH